MIKHPVLKLENIQSTTVVHLIRRLELPFKATAVVSAHVYFWKEGDRDQKLEMVMRDYLEVFWENMRDPRWNCAIFYDLGNSMIGPLGHHTLPCIGNTYWRYWNGCSRWKCIAYFDKVKL